MRGVSFQVARGEVFGLLGPNGAGKTTAVEILEGFRGRDAGEVRVLGYDPASRPRALRERIGIVLQECAVEPYLTVREVLRRNASYYPAPRPVAEVAELVGLAAMADVKVAKLSGGQQRRLDVGLGIIGRPELIFLDEPTTGFDPTARRGAWDLVRSLSDGGATIILTTHYMDEAEALADRVAVIARGQIVAEGPPSSLGGRDVSEAKLRFRLPEDCSSTSLPVPVHEVGDLLEVATTDEVEVLHLLTGWSLAEGVPLLGLSVERLTLEDVYLRLTAGGDAGGTVGAPGALADGVPAGRSAERWTPAP
ncbi:MAG: ABC-type multidrug transport system, ATPase component [Acidimicrobiaceae bacterium]|nr:ABC-type multidrug transport system, ATPase component [Acidimicrobiaceae bacterium]